MFWLPPATRSGTKVKRVLLSTDGKKKFERVLSAAEKTETTQNMPDKKTARKLTGYDVIDSLVAKLTEKIKPVDESAMQAAMSAANEKLVSLQGELTNLSRRMQEV